MSPQTVEKVRLWLKHCIIFELGRKCALDRLRPCRVKLSISLLNYKFMLSLRHLLISFQRLFSCSSNGIKIKFIFSWQTIMAIIFTLSAWKKEIVNLYEPSQIWYYYYHRTKSWILWEWNLPWSIRTEFNKFWLYWERMMWSWKHESFQTIREMT